MNRPSQPSPRHELFWAAWSVVAAFGTYFCMYMYRKPFTVETFEDDLAFGLALKPVLLTAQILGYMLSKFIGIKVIAELPPERRVAGIALLITLAEAALVGFGLVPPPWNAACMFANGLALGMVFGMVLGFLEGRQQTEALTAGLCASFILAGGVTKAVGGWLLALGVSRFWMPSAAGALFLLPLALCLWMLSRIPPPDAADIAARSARSRLDREGRWSLLSRYAAGLTALVVVYLAVSILRTIRDDFAAEIWRALGFDAAPSTFAYSEMWVAGGVLAATAVSVWIRDNRRAFFTALATCGLGFALLAAALACRQQGLLGSFAFMVLSGLGLYLPYVAFHTTIFERLLAMTRDRGNIGFLMYVVDSIGYLGSVIVLLVCILRKDQVNFLFLFMLASWIAVGVSAACLAIGWRYFAAQRAGCDWRGGGGRMSQTLAAVFHGPDQPLEMRRIEMPEPCGAEILVRVLGCTLCGSDLHSFEGRRKVATPTILGHEIVGRIATFGETAPRRDIAGQELSVGDRVTWSIVASCGECFYCRRGLPQKCQNAVKYGHEPLRPGRELTGGLAENCLLAPGTAIVRLPDELPLEVACPASCATATIAAALEAAGEVRGRSVCILGAGLLGLTAAAMARSAGAAAVIVAELQPERRERALEFGATEAIEPAALASAVNTATGNFGVDAVLELTGAVAAFAAAWPLVRLGGAFVLVGSVFPGAPAALPLEQIVRQNLTLRGIHNYAPRHLHAGVQFLTKNHKQYPLAQIVSRWLPLTRSDEAFAAARDPRHIRIGVITADS